MEHETLNKKRKFERCIPAKFISLYLLLLILFSPLLHPVSFYSVMHFLLQPFFSPLFTLFPGIYILSSPHSLRLTFIFTSFTMLRTLFRRFFLFYFLLCYFSFLLPFLQFVISLTLHPFISLFVLFHFFAPVNFSTSLLHILFISSLIFILFFLTFHLA